ncbi:hypothetical protein [Noviherbaspirillum saxi]|uniref:Big-1 domain-containing protein n=1 Tax=Noviherbaspirillum saxi TaxID=2320863 RepID=A0A3A3FZS5_9BURK|nr:hypothetical protein [Noviherbaspirillum saxi]RJF99701.1 hypothetical protein D3871_15105 [Noviherbaspirillum saxi]
MGSTLSKFFNKYIALMMYALCTTLLVACGGGGGSPGTTGIGNGGTSGGNGSTTTAGKIVLALADASGAASTSVTGSNSLIVKATVTNATGVAVKNTVVAFTLDGDLAVLSPSSGTALTDDNGVAQVSVKSAGKGSGATNVTAKATVGTAEVTAKTAFSIGAAPTATPIAISFATAIPNDKSIVIKGAGGNGRTEVALLTFRVVDSSGSGVPNVPVTFSTPTTTSVTLASSTGTTDTNGNITVAVNAGSQPTTVTVVAAVQGTSISTISDTITVTTGQAVQTAFSLSAEKFYVEGMNVDNVTNKVIALLADANGGAVADGTQVVFTTDGGAIVGEGGARCLTVKGECSVTWRSQNPRPASGVVTVTATATNATSTLSASRSFFMSGSFPNIRVVSPIGVQSSVNGPIAHNFGTSCTPVTLRVEATDDRNNPLPEGTVVSAANTADVTVTVSPASVAYDGRPLVGGQGGSLHDVKVTPTNCAVTGTTTKTGSFDLTVKAPLGSALPVPASFIFRVQ